MSYPNHLIDTALSAAEMQDTVENRHRISAVITAVITAVSGPDDKELAAILRGIAIELEHREMPGTATFVSLAAEALCRHAAERDTILNVSSELMQGQRRPEHLPAQNEEQHEEQHVVGIGDVRRAAGIEENRTDD